VFLCSVCFNTTSAASVLWKADSPKHNTVDPLLLVDVACCGPATSQLTAHDAAISLAHANQLPLPFRPTRINGID